MNRFLSGVQRVLDERSDATALLKRVAHRLVPDLADFCLIHLVDGDVLWCVASAHVNRDGRRVTRLLGQVYRIERGDPLSTVAQVVRTGRPQLRRAITAEDEITPQRPTGVAELHRRLAPRSVLVVPLASSTRILGAMTLGHSTSGRAFGTRDPEVAARFGARVGSIIERRDRARAGRRSRTLRVRARL